MVSVILLQRNNRSVLNDLSQDGCNCLVIFPSVRIWKLGFDFREQVRAQGRILSGELLPEVEEVIMRVARRYYG